MLVEALLGERKRAPGEKRLLALAAFRAVGKTLFQHPVRRLAIGADYVHEFAHGCS